MCNYYRRFRIHTLKGRCFYFLRSLNRLGKMQQQSFAEGVGGVGGSCMSGLVDLMQHPQISSDICLFTKRREKNGDHFFTFRLINEFPANHKLPGCTSLFSIFSWAILIFYFVFHWCVLPYTLIDIFMHIVLYLLFSRNIFLIFCCKLI